MLIYIGKKGRTAMPKKSRLAPRYASRYESLRPFLRFLAWGC